MGKTRSSGVTANYAAALARLGEKMEESQAAADFLPPPEALLEREKTVKVTVNLSRRSVDFFKKQAARQGLPYQQMVRRILDLYAERYEEKG